MSVDDINPYQSPQSSDTPVVLSERLCWRDDKLLVTLRKAALPDRCVKCNAPAEGYRLRRTITWQPQWVYLLILLGLVPFLIVYLIVRKQVKVEFGLCRRHIVSRRRTLALIILLFVGGITALVNGLFLTDSGAGGPARGRGAAKVDIASVETLALILVCASPILLVGTLIFALFSSQILTAKQVDKQFAWLKGCCGEFLAELPPFE